jgi:hypothetical protein
MYPRQRSMLALTIAWFPDAGHFSSYCHRVEALEHRSGLDHRHVKLYRSKRRAETSAEIPRWNGTSSFHHIARPGDLMARTLSVGRRFLSVLVLCIAATCLAIGATLLFQLSIVSRAVSDFSQDETRERARITHGGQGSLDERLNQAYLKRYDLDPGQYTDSQGHFSPTGADWQRWRLRTKAAATVMWLGHDPPGTWWTLQQIKCVDRFPEAHADSEPIVDIADACLGQPH